MRCKNKKKSLKKKTSFTKVYFSYFFVEKDTNFYIKKHRALRLIKFWMKSSLTNITAVFQTTNLSA